MRHFLLAAALTAGLAVGATPANTLALPQSETCTGVWVVVDYGSAGGGTTVGCATSYTTGLNALQSAGFSVSFVKGQGNFVGQISDKPKAAQVDINKAYWSYWSATSKPDGTWSNWTYAAQGAASRHPKQGDAEGWHYIGVSDRSGPGVRPPSQAARPSEPPASETAKPVTTAEPSATTEPTATAKPPAASKPSATTKPTPKQTTRPSAKPTAKPPAEPAAKPATARPTPSVSPPADPNLREGTQATPPDTGEPTASEPAGVSDPATTPASTPQPNTNDLTADAAATPDAGSPIGAIVAGALIGVAGIGLAGWWLLRGRKR